MSAYRVTFRIGPVVERERFDALEDALIAVEAKLRSMGGRPQRGTRSVLGRDYEPVRQVAARAEVKGPRGLRAGIDLRGDGSCEAWTGRLGRRPVEQDPGEDAFAALRRVTG